MARSLVFLGCGVLDGLASGFSTSLREKNEVGEIRLRPGGCAVNEARAVNLVSKSSAKLAVSVGTDPAGNLIRTLLEHEFGGENVVCISASRSTRVTLGVPLAGRNGETLFCTRSHVDGGKFMKGVSALMHDASLV